MNQKETSTTALPFRNFFINSYILPGFLFLSATILACYTFRFELYKWTLFRSSEFETFIKPENFNAHITADYSLVFELTIVAIILFISLILGNAISVIGGLLFDTLWMGKGIGWSYERILSFYPKNYTRRAMHIFIFTLLNLISLLFIFDCLYGKSYVIWLLSIGVFYLARELWIKYVLFKIYGDDKEVKVFHKKKTKKERHRLFELMFVYWKKYREIEPRWLPWFLAYFFSFGLFIDLSVFLAIVLGKFFGLSIGIDNKSRKQFKKYYRKALNQEKIKNNTNVYWYSYIHLSNSNPENLRIANSHLKRSILLRNLAATGVIIIFILFLLKPEFNSEPDAVNDFYYRWKVWTLVWYVSSYLLFIGYNHIIHKYYTKFLIRCFIVDSISKEEND